MTVAASTINISAGLASGLDSGSIINSLITADSIPLSEMKSKSSALQSQVSLLGDLTSKLSSLNEAIQDLKTSGVRATTVSSANFGFTATPQSDATESTSSIQVLALAEAAKQRSQGFASSSAAVTGGTYHLNVQGVTTDITVTDGESLQDFANAINSKGAGVSASIVSDGTQSYLQLANKSTGFPIGGDPSQALSLTSDLTGSQGAAVTMSQVSPAQNAKIMVDGLALTRQSNVITDAVQGATINLKEVTAEPEDLVMDTDSSGTATNLQKFVDAYNSVMSAIQAQTNISQDTDRNSTLAGDSALRTLTQQLQGLITSNVSGLGGVDTLADLGVATNKDGSLTLNTSVLNTALQTDPDAINTIFNSNSDGIGALSQTLTDSYTNAADGIFTSQTSSLNGQISDLSDQEATFQTHLDAERASLTAEFSAMESAVSTYKSVASYLTALENKSDSSS